MSKKCVECGTSNPERAKFCSDCGKVLVEVVEVEVKETRNKPRIIAETKENPLQEFWKGLTGKQSS